jgi:hypothetical protein
MNGVDSRAGRMKVMCKEITRSVASVLIAVLRGRESRMIRELTSNVSEAFLEMLLRFFRRELDATNRALLA